MRVVLRKEELAEAGAAGAAVAVVDVLRASSTAVSALAAGATAIHPCAGPDEARSLAARLRAAGVDCLVGGEVGALKVAGFDLGNSPREFTPEAVGGRAVVLATSNGTRALRSLPPGVAGVALACFLNAGAAARWLAEVGGRAPAGALVACAGSGGAFSYEDFLGAGALVARLEALLPGRVDADDPARAARDAYLCRRGQLAAALAEGRHARHLERCGLGEDVAFCAREDVFDLVPAAPGAGGAPRVFIPWPGA